LYARHNAVKAAITEPNVDAHICPAGNLIIPKLKLMTALYPEFCIRFTDICLYKPHRLSHICIALYTPTAMTEMGNKYNHGAISEFPSCTAIHSLRRVIGIIKKKLIAAHSLSVKTNTLAASLSDSGSVIASSYRPVANIERTLAHATKSATNPKSSGV
jgi:hypothetical protein